MPFFIVRRDITRLTVDAIVNPANTSLAPGGGVCGAIYHGAGFDNMAAACEPLAPIQVGDAVITPGFKLPAKYVIHTAGPIYDPKKRAECEKQLRRAYRNSLRIAIENNCQSIAFPLISSGIYGYPKDEALAAARDEIDRFLEENDLDVTLVVFDKDSFKVSQKLFGEVQEFVDNYYVPERSRRFGGRSLESSGWTTSAKLSKDQALIDFEMVRGSELSDRDESEAGTIVLHEFQLPDIQEAVQNLDETFSEALLRLIDERDLKDSAVYKRANLDRKLFSKIRINSDYRPTKSTVIALAIALKLSLPETQSLLQKAGFALSRSQKFDVIIEFFITHAKYDIFEINEILFEYDQPLLGQRV